MTRATVRTINSVLGDESFVFAYGRSPTLADDASRRIFTHLTWVEGLLRQRGRSASAGKRAVVLDHLRRYATAGAFPEAETDDGHGPVFIDRRGMRCAVAHLIEQTAGTELAAHVDRRHHHDFIAAIDDGPLDAWSRAWGLTREELAMIQPAYPPPPTAPNIDLRASAEYHDAVAREHADSQHIVMAKGSARWNLPHSYYLGRPLLQLGGGLGFGDPKELAYDLHASAGTQFVYHPTGNGWGHLMGILGGFGVDAVGDRIPSAWTLPVDGFYFIRPAAPLRLGLEGGPRITVAGADRPLGWSTALHLVWREALTPTSDPDDEGHPFAPRDLHFTVDAQGLAGSIYVGLSVGIGTRARHGFYERPW